MIQKRNLKKTMNKSLEHSCPSGLTNKPKHTNYNNKLKVSKGRDPRVCKGRTIPSFYFCKEHLENKGSQVRTGMEKEGRVHGGPSLLELALKAENTSGFVYDLSDPLETRLGEVKLPEGRVHGGNLLALISANGGIEGVSN